MALALDLQAKNTLHLAPQMQYSLKLLQMDQTALAEHVLQEARNNPLISFDVIPAPIYTRDSSVLGETDFELPDLHNENSHCKDLYDQIPLGLDPELAWIVRCLIDSLDDSGYLNSSDRELCDQMGISNDVYFSALDILQSLEPAGIGAHTLSECLLLQLRRKNIDAPLACLLAEQYLEDIAAGRLRKIARETKHSLDQVEESVKLIQSLSPRPISRSGEADKSLYIVPDVDVSFEEGKLLVSLTENSFHLNREPSCEALFAHAEELQIKSYLKQCSSSFSKLERALVMRADTLLSVTKIIVNRQEPFFRDRNCPLLPLSLFDISTELNLHVSTISKTVQNKYLRCPWGVFPLRHFIVRYMQNENLGSDKASGQDQVSHAIYELVSSENPDAPLSDQQIFVILHAKGLVESRRSIAYYRKKAGIQSSYSRKKRK